MQANSFASEVLMPEGDFRKMVRDGKNKIDELAQEFGVSTLALRIRAKNLGMSGHGL
jgi:Zn-dependent peptidase ImmA (M78 family)